MASMADIQKYADRIASEYNPDKIILFGSRAKGANTEDSDVDLLVIMPFEGRNLDKSVEILVRTNPDFPIDLLARKPEDTQRRYQEGDPLIRAAIDQGATLYERAG